jgi:hypothetical protein
MPDFLWKSCAQTAGKAGLSHRLLPTSTLNASRPVGKAGDLPVDNPRPTHRLFPTIFAFFISVNQVIIPIFHRTYNNDDTKIYNLITFIGGSA